MAAHEQRLGRDDTVSVEREAGGPSEDRPIEAAPQLGRQRQRRRGNGDEGWARRPGSRGRPRPAVARADRRPRRTS